MKDLEWDSDISKAPYQTVLWVQNEQMDEPVKATRGYATARGVHKDQTFFTSVYTPHKFFPTRSGDLVCPTKWALAEVVK